MWAAGRSTCACARSGPRRPPRLRREPKPKPTRKAPARAKPKAAAGAEQGLEHQIEAAEAALRSIEDELSDPAAWATPQASARSTRKHEQAKQAVAELYERWEAIAG